MLFKEAACVIDNNLYPIKNSKFTDSEIRQALSLSYEALKIIDDISKRFRELPKDIQESLTEYKIITHGKVPQGITEHAYKFIVDTVDEIELLEEDELQAEMPY